MGKKTIQMGLTAGYNADIARVYGINEALLLDSIVFWQRNSRRQDGYCWFTADEFEIKTAVKKLAMKRAIDNLVEAGVIEVKNTYIIGTQVKCRHFRLVKEPETESSERIETIQSESIKTIQSERIETIQSVNSSNRTLTELHNKSKDLLEPTAQKTFPDGKPDFRNEDVQLLVDKWAEITGNPPNSQKWHRIGASHLAKKFGVDVVIKVMHIVRQSYDDQYAPRINDLQDLWKKWGELGAWAYRKQASGKKTLLDETKARGTGIEITPDDL